MYLQATVKFTFTDPVFNKPIPASDYTLPQLWRRLKASCDYDGRLAAVNAFNAGSPWVKRGITITHSRCEQNSFTGHLLNENSDGDLCSATRTPTTRTASAQPGCETGSPGRHPPPCCQLLPAWQDGQQSAAIGVVCTRHRCCGALHKEYSRMRHDLATCAVGALLATHRGAEVCKTTTSRG